MQALMYVIVTCKYKKDPIKNSRENVIVIGLLVSEIFMFESVDARTDAGSSPIL